MDDIYQLDGPRFFRLAWRLSVYGGVIAMRLEEQMQQREQNAQPVSGRRQAAGHDPVAEFTAFAAVNPGLFERHRVNGG